MQDMFQDITGVILAGGKSSRMRRDKALLEVEGVSLFQRMLQTLQELFPQVLIAGDRKDLAQPGVPCYADPFPGSSLGGIYTGLLYSHTDYIFVAPCDMPFPDPELIRLIIAERQGFDAVVTLTPAGPEPCFALYSRRCLEPIKKMLDKGDYSIKGNFYTLITVRYVDAALLPEGWQRSLVNVNTPEEYRSLLEKK